MTPEELFEKLIEKVPGVQDQLDDLVVDEHIAMASGVNNEGLTGQLEFLLQGWTLDEILAHLELDHINPLTGEPR